MNDKTRKEIALFRYGILAPLISGTYDENKSSEKLKDKKVNIPKQSQNKPKEKQGDILDTLLKDKEATIIILMIFFLYDDNCDPMLIMALIYLLI